MDTEEIQNKTCPKCGTPAEGKFCPECGERLIIEPVKQEGKKVSKWKDRIFLGICIIAVIIIWAWLQPPSTHSGNSGPVNSFDGWSQNTFEGAAKTPDYESLARYPEQYTNNPIKLTGEISQVQESYGTYTLRVATKKMTYGNNYAGDDIWVSYNSKRGSRPLENDIVTIYGVSKGLKDYTTVLGASRTIPSVDAYFIKNNGRSS